MNVGFPTYFRHAREEALKSNLRTKVGACLVAGKSIFRGHNKDKTHPEFANPEIHERKSLHAELDCFLGFDQDNIVDGEIYVYREVDGVPAMARPCNHCMKFLKKYGITKIYYTIPHFPYWDEEEI